jgi:hypothetical protein
VPLIYGFDQQFVLASIRPRRGPRALLSVLRRRLE